MNINLFLNTDLYSYLPPFLGDKIPSDIGGCLEIEFDQWLTERMTKEEQGQSQKPSSTSSSSSLLAFNSALFAAKPLSDPKSILSSDSNNLGNPLEGQALGLLSQLIHSGQSSSLPNAVVSGVPPLPQLQPSSFSGISNGSASKLFLDLVHSSNPVQLSNSAHGGVAMDIDKKVEKKPAKGPKSIIKSGRKSDPRMDAAVEAKINDPDLSLVDALRQGGFVFPIIDETSAPQYTVVDSDNVKITQRKNQLLRRLRSMKKMGA